MTPRRVSVVRVARSGIPALTLLTLLATCTDDRTPLGPARWRAPTGQLTADPPMVLVGAGDIAMCTSTNDEATASLLDGIAGAVFTAGDNAYDNGSAADYQNCYNPSWGRHKARTHPAPGNHEYNTLDATAYFNYFGAAAGEAGKGYYSYDLGDWHIIALNNYIPMTTGSEQDNWLRADLAATTQPCKLAYYHEPLYSSTTGGGSGGITTPTIQPLFRTLYGAAVDVVVNGHRHFYERLAPINPDGQLDAAGGIREFIAGTGGASIQNPTNLFPLSEVRFGSSNFGVLKLYLYSDSYAWRFVPVPGRTLSDTGSSTCHEAASGVDPTLSTVVAAPSSITAGSGTTTITVRVKDPSGNPVSGAGVELAATGSGNTLTQPTSRTDANGVATGTLSSTVAETKTVTARANAGPISQAPQVTVTPAPLSAEQSAVTAAPHFIAPGSQTATITVTATDAFGNPRSGVAVALAATGFGNTLTQPAGTTGQNGVATGTLSSTVEEVKTISATVNGAPLTRTTTVVVTTHPSMILHSLLTAGNNAVNQQVYTTAAIAPAPNTLITLAVMAHNATSATPSPTVTGGGMSAWTEVTSTTFHTVSLPHTRLTVFRAMSPAPGSGPITITFNHNMSHSQWIVSQWEGVETSGVNGAGAIGETGSRSGDAVSGLTVPLAAFGNSNDVAYGVFGVAKNVAAVTPGAGFTEISEQPSAESTPSDLEAEWATNLNTIAATWTNLNGAALGVQIKAGSSASGVDPAQSTVSASPTSITPEGAGATITVAVKDGNGNPMSGVTVELFATGSGNTLTQPEGGTDNNGEVTGTFASTVAETKTVLARANGAALNQTALVTVTPGPPSASISTVTASPTSITAGSGVSNITVTVKDDFGNRISGATVVLAASGTGNTLTQPGPTDGNGIATGTLSSTEREAKTVSATADGTLITQTATVTVTGTPVSASRSTVTASPSSITAGSGSSTITVTAKDANGAPISGATVVLAATGSGNTLTQPTGPTDGNGVATGTLSSTGAGTKTVSATANGTTITQAAAVTVTAGPVSAAQSTVAASPSSFVAGSGSSTITVTAKDGFGNPVSGATVVLAATGSGNTLTQPAGPTGANGVATGTLSSTVAEPKTISATAGGTAITQTATVTVTPPAPPSAITQTLLTVGTDIVNQRVYTTASIAPAPNTLITVAVLEQNSTSAPPSPTLSGGGMTTWTEVASVTFDAVATPHRRLTIFRAMSAAPGSGPITITSSVTLSHCQWIVSQWAGAETGGVNGADAIVQTGSSRGDAVNGLTVPLAAFGNANNMAYGVFGVNRNVAVIAPGAGFTEIAEQPSGESTPGDVEAELAANRNAIGATWTNLNGGALGVEIQAAAGSGSGVDPERSTVTASPSAIIAGSGSSTITVTVKDASGTPISGATVELSATGAGNTLTQPAGLTDGNGVATGTLSSTVAGTKTVSATASGTLLSQTAAVTVTAGPVSAAQSTVAASPSSFVAGSGSSTITVTAQDGFGNRVSGATVVLAATGNGNTLTQPVGPTDANGVATGTLSSTVAEPKTVSATAGGTAITQTATVTVTPDAAATITQTLLTAGTDIVNQRVYTTASIAPAPNTLITVAVLEHNSTSAPPSPTLSGGGMTTWTQVASVTLDAVATPHRRLTIFRAMSAAPGSGAITITSSVALSHCQWIVSQWDGVETSGVNGADAIVQTNSSRGDAVTGLSVPLGAFGSAQNVGYGAFGVNRNMAVVAPGTGFTEIAEQPSGESTPGDLQAEWGTNDNTIDATWPLNLNGGALGVEIRARR